MMMERKADREPPAAAPLQTTPTRQSQRKRWPLGLMLYGILTALAGLALLVVE